MHGYGGREEQRMGCGAGTYGRRHLNSGMNRMRNAGLESRRNPSLMTPPELKVQVAIFMTVARGCEKRRRGAVGCFPGVMAGVPQRCVNKVQIGAIR